VFVWVGGTGGLVGGGGWGWWS